MSQPAWAAIAKMPQTEWLKQQKLIFLQFWRLGSPGSKCWPCWILLSVALDGCPHVAVPLYLSVSCWLLLIKDISSIGLEAPIQMHSQPELPGVRASTHTF